jgi:hypothetical protein
MKIKLNTMLIVCLQGTTPEEMEFGTKIRNHKAKGLQLSNFGEVIIKVKLKTCDSPQSKLGPYFWIKVIKPIIGMEVNLSIYIRIMA